MGAIELKLREKLEAELLQLKHDLPKELMKARAHGDLSENAEFKYAKERQAYLTARMGQLQKRLSDVSMLNLDNLPHDKAAYGSRVVVLDTQKSLRVEYKLVTTEESDASKGLISTTSPIGRALLGRAQGEVVIVRTPAGEKEFEILRLFTIHEEM